MGWLWSVAAGAAVVEVVIAWFCSDGVFSFQKGLLMLVSHVNLSVQYFSLSKVIEVYFFLPDIARKNTEICVWKPPDLWLCISVPYNWLEINVSFLFSLMQHELLH